MIIRRLFAVFMLAVLAVGTANTADAQLFKKRKKKHKQEATTETESHESRKERKRHRKEERRREKEEKRKHKSKKEKSGNKKKTGRNSSMARRHNVNYPATVLKTRYRIDLLAPLYLDELVKDDKPIQKEIPEKAVAGVAFYQGVKLAADSLAKAGMSIDVYVHDIASADALIANKHLDSSDLVLGLVQSRDVPVLAALAKKRKINFVSALSPATGNIKDNPYFTMLQPSLKTNCEWISSDITKKFPNLKVAMLYRTTVQVDDNARNYFTDEIEGENEIRELRCNTLPTKEEMLAVFDTTKPNVVIIPVLDADYADTLLSALTTYFPGTHFEVYGMPTWTTLRGLRKTDAYRNLTINIPQPFHFDRSNPSVQNVETNYRRQFNGSPSDWVLRGYETMTWYAGLLSKYGTIFNEKYIDLSDAPWTKFSVVPVWDKRGYILYHENKHLYLTTYEAGMSRTTE